MSGPQLLLGKDGSTFANLIGATQLNAAGNAIYFKNGYSSPTGGLMLFFHVNWRPSGDSANFLKGCVYQNGTLVAVSSPIAKPAVAGDVFAPITGTINPNLPYILVAVPDQGYWTAAVDSGTSASADRQNTAANFNYTNPPQALPAADVTVGLEAAMWVEGGPIALVNTVFTPNLQAPITLIPVSATLALNTSVPGITAKTSPLPATATITYGGLSVTLSLGIRPIAGALSMGTAAPSLTVSAAGVKQPVSGSLTFATGAPSLFINNPGTISHGQPVTFVLPGGTGAGTKTIPGPQVFDDCSDAPPGSISAQWTANTRLPAAAGGIYNYQNQPPGFDPSNSGVGVPNMHVSGISAGAHLVQGSNDSNTVGTGFKYTVPTLAGAANYPWCDTREYYYRYDPAWNSDPTSDNNLKIDEDGVGGQVFDPSNQYQYQEPSQCNQFGIIGIQLTNPLVVTFGTKQATNPFSVTTGGIIEFFDVLGTTQINGLATPITATGGVNGAWTVTCGAIDATGWSPLATPMTVTNITNAYPGVMTVSSVNPPTVNQQFTVQGVAGMTQINGQTMKAGTATGSPGNWTFPLLAVGFIGANFDTRTTSGFGVYSGGGTITCGGGSVPYNNQMTTRSWAANPSAGQMQYPTDGAGNSSTKGLNPILMPFNPANGWIKRRIERCITNIVGSPGNTGPGYYRVFDNNVLIYDYVGRTDWLSPSSLVRHMSYGSAYARDRGPTNFCFISSGFYDVSDQGVTGQCPRAYLGDQPILANCTVLEPQVPDVWTDGSVHIPKLNAGKFLPGATAYKLICPAAGPKGTSINCGSITIGPTAQPVVNNTTFLPALVGQPYSASVSVTGGVPPYKYYVPNPEANGWTINVNTGIISATAPSVAGSDSVTIGVVDSAGTNGIGVITIPVVNFDFFVAPNGDDNNAGTLAAPWSITAFNTKMTTYAGKKVGLIGDQGAFQQGKVGGVVSTLYDLITAHPSNNTTAIIQIQGGSASSPTYVGSCNSSGVYVPRLATINAAQPGTGLVQTKEEFLMGQNNFGGGSLVTQYGNVTIDGLVMLNWQEGALVFQNSAVTAGLLNLIIQNCEFYNTSANVASTNNPAAIALWGTFGAKILNCKFHDLSCKSGGGSLIMCAMISFVSYNTLMQNCTGYNCGGPCTKDDLQSITLSYCYFEAGNFGSAMYANPFGFPVSGFITGAAAGTGTSAKSVIDHCIMVGPVWGFGQDAKLNAGALEITNTTFFSNQASLELMAARIDNTTGGTLKWQNNLVYSTKYTTGANNAGTLWVDGKAGITAASVNFNAYGTGMTFATAYSAGNDNLPIATWKGFGFDANSITLASSPFVTPPTSHTSSFAITGPALTAGVGGTACGAVDGTGPVGCNF